MGIHVLSTILHAIGSLFKKHPQATVIEVGPAAQKCADVINQIITDWETYKSLIEPLVSDEGITTLDGIETELKQISGDLEAVQTLGDVAAKLDGYKFSDDPRKDQFYHSVIGNAALMTSDGHISLLEGVTFIALIVGYIEGK